MKIKTGTLEHGARNLITDVPGVRVGHATVDQDECHTGVTVVLPGDGNPFTHKKTAASVVFNGFGKTQGLVQLDELGTLETPIALTNTLNVGRVHDALVGWLIEQCGKEGIRLTSVNPVVGECNDSRISRIEKRPVGEKEVRAAIQTASEDFREGAVGAGRGTICYGMKGGIGSASRLMRLDGKVYTLGVLVQSNYGASSDFRWGAVPEGISESDQGSIMIILATDLPLSARQLKRVLKRTSVGMARLGSYIGHGSGEIAIGFTTAERERKGDSFTQICCLNEDLMNLPFRAAAEATEEAILHSLLAAEEDRTLDGKTVPSFRNMVRNSGPDSEKTE